MALRARILWTLAKSLYWLDRHWWRPSSAANDIIDWMEVRGLCCEKQWKEVSNNPMNALTYTLYRTGLLFKRQPFGCSIYLAVIIGIALAIFVNLRQC